MTWSEVETKSTPPQPCYGHTATHIGDNQILVFGGKGYQVTNNISIFDLSMSLLTCWLTHCADTREWKHYAYAGNTLVSRWGHSATLHRDRFLVIYGGRDNNGYWNTIDTIDIRKWIEIRFSNFSENQLIELKENEQKEWEKEREEDIGAYIKASLGNLQVF